MIQFLKNITKMRRHWCHHARTSVARNFWKHPSSCEYFLYYEYMADILNLTCFFKVSRFIEVLLASDKGELCFGAVDTFWIRAAISGRRVRLICTVSLCHQGFSFSCDLSFLPIRAFPLFNGTNDWLEGNLDTSCIFAELIDNLLRSLLLAQYLHHSFLEWLLFLFHLQADLKALDLGLTINCLIEIHEASSNSCQQMVVSDQNFHYFRAN